MSGGESPIRLAERYCTYLPLKAAQAHRALEQELNALPLVRPQLARQLWNHLHFIF